MLKAFLISLATLITFDAVAWQGTVRTETVRQLGIAAQVYVDHDWTWGKATARRSTPNAASRTFSAGSIGKLQLRAKLKLKLLEIALMALELVACSWT